MVENEKCTLQELEYGKKIEKRAKCDTNTVLTGICRETLIMVENEKCTMLTWNMAKKLKNFENEKHTHCRT